MLTVISPAKTLDFETQAKSSLNTTPEFLTDSMSLVEDLKKFSPKMLCDLMGVSDQLGELNRQRYQQWKTPFTTANAKQAVLAFKGDVYNGLDAESFTAADFRFAQKHLRILSGLYGVLRPMDLIQPYRLEMGVKFGKSENSKGKNLYRFWGEQLTKSLNRQLNAIKSDTLINLASNEYFKSVKEQQLEAEVVTPVFKDFKRGDYKIIGFFAKKARGLMSAYIIQNRIADREGLMAFNAEGYRYSNALSSGNEMVFTRKQWQYSLSGRVG